MNHVNLCVLCLVSFLTIHKRERNRELKVTVGGGGGGGGEVKEREKSLGERESKIGREKGRVYIRVAWARIMGLGSQGLDL